MNILDFQRMRKAQQKISFVTCYDYWSASIIAKSNVDCILVGDSVAMVMYGHPTTVNATVSMMVSHTEAVARGASNKFIVSDLPFLSYRKGLEPAMDAVHRLMQAGANAIKLEGVIGNEALIEHLVQSGVPVMGHIGLTPQSVNQLGGFKVQGKNEQAAASLLEQAKILEQVGCFSMILECIPRHLGQSITEAISIPTIGIGAGEHTSGQVLVLQDLLGCNSYMSLKFLKKYFNAEEHILKALNQYGQEVKDVTFPSEEYSFTGGA